MPVGIRWNFHFSSPRTIVWPALLPPWKRITMSARSARRSTTFPLPSSPHWTPTTAMPGTRRSLREPLGHELPVGGLGAVGAHQRDDLAHLLEPRDGPPTDRLVFSAPTSSTCRRSTRARRSRKST